jgi:glycosyltransferase involved in cell wall biosynthesis
LPLTVLTVASTLARCGPINVMMGVIRHFDPERYGAVLATLSPERADSCIGDFRSLGIPIKLMGLSRAGAFLSGARRLRHLVSEVKPDILHSHGLRADILAAKARLSCPIVSTLHCDLLEDYRLAFGRCPGTLMAVREYAALKRFDGVIAVSEGVAKAAFQADVSARVIPNGVELGEYCPATDLHRVRAIRENLGWAQDAAIVLHTGSLTSRKNPVEVVTGFRASGLSKRGMLIFAGDGPLRSECVRAASGASNIVFLGDRKDIADLLKAADILISASSSEGLPMALLEGCASGIRVLATDIPPHRYIQKTFPDQVQILGDRDSNTVQAAFDRLRIGQRFLPSSSALEMISSRRMSSQYQEFYSDILKSRNPAIQ